MEKRTFISLSTIPTRINDIEPVLESLINQTVKPYKIFINAPKKYARFSEKLVIPEFLSKKKFKDVAEVYYTDEDYGPATKFIGSLINKEIKPNDLLLITDDDIIKQNKWIEILLKNHKNNRVTSFVERSLGNKIIWGYLGYVFQKKFINLQEVVKFYKSVSSKCFLVDDHWLTGYCHYKKLEIYNVPISLAVIINKNGLPMNKDALVNIEGDNSRGIVSQRCRNVIKDQYGVEFPFWCCLGCCKFGYPIKFEEGFGNVKNNSFMQFIIMMVVIAAAMKYLSVKNETILLVTSSSLLLYGLNYNNITKIEKFQNTIPNKLVQTYYNKFKIPNKVYQNLQKFAPEYEHILYDDTECIAFIKKYYSLSVAMAFEKLKGAHKADLFRYCYLYKFGGVYLDIKTELIMPLNKVFNKNQTYSVLSIVKDTIYQGIIATPAGNPIFLKLIQFMVDLLASKRQFHYIIFTADFWHKIKEECEEKPKLGLNVNKTDPNFNYYLFQEKCSKDANDCYDGLDKYQMCCFVYDNGKKVLKTRYSDFPW